MSFYKDALGNNVTTGFNLGLSVLFFGMAAFGAWRDVKRQCLQERERRVAAENENERLKNDRPLRQIEKRNALDRFITAGHAILENLKRSNGESTADFQHWVSDLNAFGTQLKIAETDVIEEATEELDGVSRVLELVTGCSGLPTESAICAVADMLVRIETLREEIRD